MRRYSSPHRSPPRRGYSSRGRSPPRRGYGGRKDSGTVSLLVRNIPLSCRAEDLKGPFERYGPVRDVYLPKDYYSGEPRGFAFIEFVDPYDASEAQYHMNRQIFFGREITVVLAAESRKRPEEMRRRGRTRPSSYEGRLSSYHGRSRSRSRSRSCSVSRSRSPRYRDRRRSRSRSPAAKRRDDSTSPPRKDSRQNRSPRHGSKGRREDRKRSYSPEKRSVSPEKELKSRSPSPERKKPKRSPSPENEVPKRKSYSPSPDPRRSVPYSPRSKKDGVRHERSNGYDQSPARRNDAQWKSPREDSSRSPPGSRSRSADMSPGRSD